MSILLLAVLCLQLLTDECEFAIAVTPIICEIWVNMCDVFLQIFSLPM